MAGWVGGGAALGGVTVLGGVAVLAVVCGLGGVRYEVQARIGGRRRGGVRRWSGLVEVVEAQVHDQRGRVGVAFAGDQVEQRIEAPGGERFQYRAGGVLDGPGRQIGPVGLPVAVVRGGVGVRVGRFRSSFVKQPQQDPFRDGFEHGNRATSGG
ncbi:MAG: hypothetical protein L0H64_14460 [Pseudonocardia sp.]|nr:hypothetical protein [Pseudonocardia sp.]